MRPSDAALGDDVPMDPAPHASRRLILLRHAKSDWPEGVADLDRPLAERGRADAPVAGRELARLGVPDVVLCSPAQRTRATWELARQAMGPESATAVTRFAPVI